MKGNFQGDVPPIPASMKAVCALLDRCKGPYVLLYPDGGGTHVFEDCENPSDFQALVTAALLVIGDAYFEAGRQGDYEAWLQKFIDEYGAKGERAVYQEVIAAGEGETR